MLFWHCILAAASRTFCTAGKSKPIRMAMMAITTNNSISVKARRLLMGISWAGRMGNNPGKKHEHTTLPLLSGQDEEIEQVVRKIRRKIVKIATTNAGT